MHQLAFINGSTLLSIRETRGVSREFLAKKANVSVKALEQWEDCSKTDYPTMRQAERMASTLLVPLAGFYMEPSKLPALPRPSTANMRKPFDSEYESDDSQINLAISWLCSLRVSLLDTCKELGGEFVTSRIPDFGDDPVLAAAQLRSYLGFSQPEQLHCKSKRKLYLLLRKKIEAKGILLAQYGNVEIEASRGIALYYEKCPVIGVNERDRWPGQSFSAIHEMGHLSKRASTVCNQMEADSDLAEEVYCNALAGEFLVPRRELETALRELDDWKSDKSTEKLADLFSVSREVVSRRLMDAGHLSKAEYKERLERYSQELQRAKELERKRRDAGEATSFPKPAEQVAVDKHGSLYCSALLRGLDSGIYDNFDIGGMLGIRVEKLPGVMRESSK